MTYITEIIRYDMERSEYWFDNSDICAFAVESQLEIAICGILGGRNMLYRLEFSDKKRGNAVKIYAKVTESNVLLLGRITKHANCPAYSRQDGKIAICIRGYVSASMDCNTKETAEIYVRVLPPEINTIELANEYLIESAEMTEEQTYDEAYENVIKKITVNPKDNTMARNMESNEKELATLLIALILKTGGEVHVSRKELDEASQKILRVDKNQNNDLKLSTY